MNDTHGQQGEGWIGFDLDGTLAKYDGWNGIDHIGEPIEPMVSLIKVLHAEGKTVKILTARVAPRLCGETHAQGCRCGHCEEEAGKPPVLQEQYLVKLGEDGISVKRTASDYIREWCQKNLGFVPEIVYQKDHLMIDLYDDRCHQVIPNTGKAVEEVAEGWKRQAYELLNVVKEMKDDALTIRWIQRIMCACFGAMIALLLSVGCEMWLHHRAERNDPEVELRDALNRYLETKAHEPVTEAVGSLLP